MRILIVEDEERMAQTIQSLLNNGNYISDIAPDGEQGLDCILSGIYDLVILDIMLPKRDGLSVLKTVREEGIQTPVLLLTARSSVTDRIEGLDHGADYFLAKPFSAGELMACVRALLRRPREIDSGELSFGDLRLVISSGDLSCGENSVQLNRRELEILRLLMLSRGHAVPRESITERVWGFDASPESNVVDAYMSFLRKKLGFIGSRVSVASLRRIGYRLELQEEQP